MLTLVVAARSDAAPLPVSGQAAAADQVSSVGDAPQAAQNGEGTGGGGRAYTLDFVGLEEFSDVNDSLSYFTRQDETDDEIRQGLARILQFGLVRYAAQTPLADQITLVHRRPEGPVTPCGAGHRIQLLPVL